MAAPTAEPDISTFQAIPGRTRLRLEHRKLDDAVARALADVLSRIEGVRSVEVNQRTRSVLCCHDATLPAEQIVAAVREALGPPADEGTTGAANADEPMPATAKLARVVTRAFQEMNRDVLRATEGQLDLGILATLTFLSAGAVNMVTTKELPNPPWFNWAWWGFRTFMTIEAEAIRRNPDIERSRQ